MRLLRVSFIIAVVTANACTKKFDERTGIVVETVQASSFVEGHEGENIFIQGRSWRPRPAINPLDGITIFLTDGSKLNDPGPIQPRTYIDEIKLTCPKESVQKYLLYVNGNYSGISVCGVKTPVQTITHVLYFKPVTDSAKSIQIEIDELEFYKNGDLLSVLSPRTLKGSINASSTVEPREAYPAYSLFDRSKEFGWVEGKGDDGIGESIQIALDEPITLTGIEIYSGYQRSREHFEKNGTVTRLGIASGSQSVSVELQDYFGPQRVILPTSLSGKNFKFTIEAVRSGSAWKDTAISEVILLGESFARYTVFDIRVLQNEKSMLERVRGSSLESLIGEKYSAYNTCSGDEFQLVFRPNGSFVIWNNLESTTRDTSVMDGNWILEKTGSESQLYIFGALYEVKRTLVRDNTSGPYETSSVTEKSSTQIFSDRIKVSHSEVSDPCFSTVETPTQSISLQGARVRGLFTAHR